MSTALGESVTLDDVMTIVAQKRVPLAPELAGYLTLEIAEQCTKDDSEVETSHVYVSEEGSVAVVRSRKISPSGGAEASLRVILSKLLEAAGSQTPALAAAARKKSGAGVASLVEDLEGALIPVNRAAGRRALARLAREVKRIVLGVGRNARASSPAIKNEPAIAPPLVASPVAPPASQRPPPSADSFEAEESPTTARRDIPPEIMQQSGSSATLERPPSEELPTVGLTRDQLEAATRDSSRDSVDSLLDKFEVTGQREDKALSRELKAIAGLEPTPPPPDGTSATRRGQQQGVATAAEDDGVDSLLAGTPKPQQPSTKDELRARKRKEDKRQISYADDRQLPTAPTQVKKRVPSVTTEPKRGPSNAIFVVLILILLGGAAAALWTLKPGFFTGRTPEKIQQEKDDAEKERQRIALLQAIPQCRTSIVVTDAPEESEILIRGGQAPADIDKMPVGVRLEFVAMADGYVPKRAVIPLGTAWDNGPNGRPRFELAVQLDKSKQKPGQVDPWPGVEPGNNDVGGKGNGAPGVVHVISTPKGAEIWVLAGLGPNTTVEDLAPCDADVDLLVAGSKSFRKRMHVTAAQFVADATRPGWRVAKVSIGVKGQK